MGKKEDLSDFERGMFVGARRAGLSLGVDRLSAPILSILPIIDIGHFKNRFADNFFFFNANKHTIYRWHYLLVNK